MSANGTGPVSTIYFAKTALRGQAATMERLCVDRQLQEALARGPDPLHLAAMFGLDPKTAIRYAENAWQLLITATEEHDPGDVAERMIPFGLLLSRSRRDIPRLRRPGLASLMAGGPAWRIPWSLAHLDAVRVAAGSLDHAG